MAGVVTLRVSTVIWRHSSKAAFQARKAELASAGDREAVERLTDRVESDFSRLQQGAYFDGLEQYFPFLVPESTCALDYLKPGAIIALDEPNQVTDHWNRLATEIRASRSAAWRGGGGG